MSSYFHIVVMDITLIPGMHQELKTVQRDKNVYHQELYIEQE